jgi:hypothetical protein
MMDSRRGDAPTRLRRHLLWTERRHRPPLPAEVAKGEQVLSLVQANYTWKSSAQTGAAKSNGNTAIRPNDYPVGCGLFVAITRDVDDVTSNNLSPPAWTPHRIGQRPVHLLEPRHDVHLRE